MTADGLPDVVEALLSRVGAVRWQRLGTAGDRLELLGRPNDLAIAAAALEAAGFEQLHGEWLRFTGGCSIVRLVDPLAWGLPPDEVTSMLRGSESLAPLAADDVLLVAAQRLGASPPQDPELPGAAVVAAAAAEQSWRDANARLPHWGMERALELLQRVVHGGLLLAHDRDVALQELTASRGEALAAVRADARRPTLGTAPRRTVIAISGLDGAGKSSQAVALRAVLLALGVDAVVEWSRLAAHPALNVIGRPVQVALRLLRGRQTGSAGTSADQAVEPATTALRRRFGAIGAVWSAFVAVVNASSQWRTTVPHAKAGRAVIRDRYVLDSVVQLRHQYGDGRDMALQSWLVRRLSPRPVVAFLLEVDGEEAYRRKPEQWTPDELAEQAALYRAAADQLGVVRLDGTLPREEIAARIAREVWARAVS